MKTKKCPVVISFDLDINIEGIKCINEKTIYKLLDSYKRYLTELTTEAKEKHRNSAVFPCVLRTMPTCVFNVKRPIVIGVVVEKGTLRVGTVLTTKDLEIGVVESIEVEHTPILTAKQGKEVCIKINSTENITLGRQFNVDDLLYSKITRESINTTKTYFRDELTNDDWKLIVNLKDLFKIV